MAETERTEMAPHSADLTLGDRVWAILAKYGTLIVLAVLVVVMSLAAPGIFTSTPNLVNILSQISLTAIIAGALTFPLVAGEFDLSIGFQASFAGVLVAGLMARNGMPPLLAIAIVLLVGSLIGIANGALVTKLGVNALIATLGTGTVVLGLNYLYTGGAPISLPRDSTFTQLALSGLFGIPWPVYIMAIWLVVLWVILNHTPVGQSIQAVGENREAARLSGIQVNRTVVFTFVVASLGAALTGVLLTARVGSGQLTAGDGYLLASFAAVFLGSAALRDGEFHIFGTFIGVLTVGVGLNGLGILGVASSVQYIFSGGLLIFAVALSSVARKRIKARAEGGSSS